MTPSTDPAGATRSIAGGHLASHLWRIIRVAWISSVRVINLVLVSLPSATRISQFLAIGETITVRVSLTDVSPTHI